MMRCRRPNPFFPTGLFSTALRYPTGRLLRTSLSTKPLCFPSRPTAHPASESHHFSDPLSPFCTGSCLEMTPPSPAPSQPSDVILYLPKATVLFSFSLLTGRSTGRQPLRQLFSRGSSRMNKPLRQKLFSLIWQRSLGSIAVFRVLP